LGGWSGTIEEVEQASDQFTYLIDWDQRTMERRPPVYLERCERLGFESKSVWLGEEDIEADNGRAVQPRVSTGLCSSSEDDHDAEETHPEG
jgi:hypothetical protein